MQTRNSNWAYIFQVTCIAMKNYNWRDLHLRILHYSVKPHSNMVFWHHYSSGIIIILKLITLKCTQYVDYNKPKSAQSYGLTSSDIIPCNCSVIKSLQKQFSILSQNSNLCTKRSMGVYMVCNCALHKAFQLPHICEFFS